MKIDPSHISLRSATDSDQAFAYAVKKAAMRAYIEPVWGWDESFQIEFHQKDWNERRPEIVRFEDRDIGTIEVIRRSDDIHLGEFYLLPEFQRQGVGSHFMARLVEEADRKFVPLRLEVIKINPVQSLYRRFGFTVSGETSTHYQMKKEAEPGTRANGRNRPWLILNVRQRKDEVFNSSYCCAIRVWLGDSSRNCRKQKG